MNYEEYKGMKLNSPTSKFCPKTIIITILSRSQCVHTDFILHPNPFAQAGSKPSSIEFWVGLSLDLI